ncbi:prepilin-type N-terminal cleavage/methylation domain-containing protein, partial [Bacteroidales bacterium MSK.15.36]|nr:prepilin-type N-terminal cleavage/methylation domain-containing protein [Bacteroidales bacterium MSK.15.36]
MRLNKLILLLKNKKGMTLIEIVLSITILSILLLIV